MNLYEPIKANKYLLKPIETFLSLLKPEPIQTSSNIYNLSKLILTCLNREIAGLYDPSVLLSNTHLKAELIHKVSKPFNFNKNTDLYDPSGLFSNTQLKAELTHKVSKYLSFHTLLKAQFKA